MRHIGEMHRQGNGRSPLDHVTAARHTQRNDKERAESVP